MRTGMEEDGMLTDDVLWIGLLNQKRGLPRDHHNSSVMTEELSPKPTQKKFLSTTVLPSI
jgi:hypothetical protein